MKLFHSIDEFIKINNCNNSQYFSASIGNFDGVHCGHQQIFRVLNENSNKLKQINLIITFEPHPKLFYTPYTNFLLSTLDEKINKISNLKIVNNILILNFQNSLKNMEPEEFVEGILIAKLKINQLVLGENFRFGKEQRGDINLLQQYFGNNLIILDLFNHNDQIISSSTIKSLIQNGQIKEANQLLGYNYFIEDYVCEGNKLARKLGFPTANIKNNQKVLPKFGVYEVLITLPNSQIKSAIANIGIKPTIGLTTDPILEVHIPNFNGDLYNQKIKVEFLRFIRDEKKFPNLDELVRQIQKDIESIPF